MGTHSYSALGMMDQCPKRYAFKYREKVDVGSATTIEAFMGSMVHEALEELYKAVRKGKVPTVDDVLGDVDRFWDEQWTDEVVVRDGSSAEEYRGMAHNMVRRFVEARTPFQDGTTIGLEMKLDVAIDPDAHYKLFGYADRVVRVSPGHWEIHDYKTGSRLPAQADLDADRQLALYQIAVSQMYPDAVEVELVWHYLAFDMEVRSHRTPEQIEELRAETIARMRAAETCSEFPTKVGGLCGWCEYRTLCPAFAHERDLDDPGKLGEARDGAQLVDRYTQVDARIKELEREKSELSEEIIAYATEHDYDIVAGAEFQVRVWRKENACRIPGWDDPRRDDVDVILREAGLWEQYASLSPSSLSKALEAGTLPSDVASAIMQHVTLEPIVRLYVKGRPKGS